MALDSPPSSEVDESLILVWFALFQSKSAYFSPDLLLLVRFVVNITVQYYYNPYRVY